jgi:hypothetical protein
VEVQVRRLSRCDASVHRQSATHDLLLPETSARIYWPKGQFLCRKSV